MNRNETPAAATEITTILRIEGAVALAAGLVAYAALGASWWLFAALILAPDLAMLGMLLGPAAGARIYNIAHSFALPALLAAAGWFAGIPLALPLAAIWVAHIGMDRALGYGLKYPGRFGLTHLGAIGKAKRKADELAHAG